MVAVTAICGIVDLLLCKKITDNEFNETVQYQQNKAEGPNSDFNPDGWGIGPDYPGNAISWRIRQPWINSGSRTRTPS